MQTVQFQRSARGTFHCLEGPVWASCPQLSVSNEQVENCPSFQSQTSQFSLGQRGQLCLSAQLHCHYIGKQIQFSCYIQKIYFSVYVFLYVSVWVYVDAQDSYKRVSDPLELELNVVGRHIMWVLGTQPGSLEDQQVFLTTQSSLQASHPHL